MENKLLISCRFINKKKKKWKKRDVIYNISVFIAQSSNKAGLKIYS